jgi:ectoine hydroxylase-related dioxygenase (phytanoyl-CoA dioxygenase family)
MVNPAQAARSFEKNGFLVLERLLSEEEISPVSDEIDNIVNGTAKYIPKEDIIFEPGSLPPRVRNAFRVHLYNPFFMGIARNAKIVSLVEELLGRPLRLYGSQLFAKPAEVGSTVPLHQDMPYWPFEPYELLSCWIALDDSSIENGCVRFLAGSHKLGVLRHVPSNVQGNSLKLDDERIAGLPEHPVQVPRGSCVLHHCLTAHWSGPNHSHRPRRGLIMVYMSPRVRLTDPTKLRGPADFLVVSNSDGPAGTLPPDHT